jgi:hypothetical protein
MRLSLKILGILWLGLFLVIGILLFNAYKKFKPEAFIALITEQVRKNYPDAELTVGNVSYRFSLDFNLNLEQISLKRNGKLLGRVGEVGLKLPWWLLLRDQGNAHLTIKDLDIFVDHEKAPDSFTSRTALPTSSRSSVISVELPAYLKDAKYTLRAQNISVRDIHNGRRYFNLSKLLVREFKTGKNSAFELTIPIEMRHSEALYSLDLWLFGDITPGTKEWSLHYRGEFRTKETNDKLRFEDLVIAGGATFSPSDMKVLSQFDLQVEKRPIGGGTLVIDQKIMGANLNVRNFPLNYFDFLYEQIRNPFLKSLESNASGSIKFSKNFETDLSTTDGKLSFDGQMMLSDQDYINGKWQLGFMDNRLEVSFMGPKAEVSFFRRSVLNSNQSAAGQYIEELGFSGLDLAITSKPIKAISELVSNKTGPYFQTTISYKNCILGDQSYNGLFRYGRSPSQVFYQGEFKTNKGKSLGINYLQKNEGNLEIRFDKFNWHSSFNFLSPFFTAGSGELTGTALASWKENFFGGDWKVQIKALNLDSPEGKIPAFVARSFSYFNQDIPARPSYGLSLINKSGKLNIISLSADDTFKVSGSLTAGEKSSLTLSSSQSQKLKSIKKEITESYWLDKESL